MNDTNRMDESVEQMSLSIRALGVGIWDYHIDLDVMICNRRWYDITGIEYGTITNIGDFRAVVHPDDVDRATEVDHALIDHLLETGDPYQMEFRVCRPDGTVRWLRSVASIIYDETNKRRRAVGCITGITKGDEDLQAMAVVPDDDGASRDAAATIPVQLTIRETECLRWVSLGKTAWETATIMTLSRRTVEFHLGKAIRKLDASNKIHAAFIAVKLGLL